jgi:hypothetical protein
VNNLAFSPLNPIVSSIEEKKGTNELTWSSMFVQLACVVHDLKLPSARFVQ